MTFAVAANGSLRSVQIIDSFQNGGSVMGIFGSLFKSYSEKQIKKITPIVDKIEALAPKYEAMPDEAMRACTDDFKSMLAQGSSLDDILPEAFALVREADMRVLGKRPFRVQIMGGILLHQGRIAEMKTGEGKTLVATMPAYLNALTGKGVHIVTVNDYLAERDSDEMGKVFGFLGLTTGLIVHGQKRDEKRAAYRSDITYGTNNELGFDYLRDNMALRKEDTVQRGHAFAIVDEVDSILIDEARTPLIISGTGSKSTELYERANALVRTMSKRTLKEFDPKRDYDVDKEFFDINDSTGNGTLFDSAISDFKKKFSFTDSDYVYEEGYLTASLTDSGVKKLLDTCKFSEEDFTKVFSDAEQSESQSRFIFTKTGIERAEAILNSSFNFNPENKNYATLTSNGVKKLVNFFEVDEFCFEHAEFGKDSYFIDEKGVESAKKAMHLSDKDFSPADNTSKRFYISAQGVDRISAAFNFDYFVDEKGRNAILTKRGVDKAERFFRIENLSSPANSDIKHHVSVAIRAHGVMKRDVDYVVKDGDVLIVDTFTGRLMPGRRYNDGLHQAIEAKEGVAVQKESQTVASITFQNYFRMYSKLSGMTGTALTEDNEFREIYSLDVVEVPTNRPMIRIDYNDSVYRTKAEKLNAIIEQIRLCHSKGQPVLVGTVSVDKSEELSTILKRHKIPHNVLNAKQHQKEASIIAAAGTVGAVTISTNMAGRGTDIMLGGNPDFLAKEKLRAEGYDDGTVAIASGTNSNVSSEVLEAREKYNTYVEEFKIKLKQEAENVRRAGGLFIIGTERHESRRIDNQLRGRSGRQGDPGESRFYLSLEDDLLRLFGSERLMGLAGFGIEKGKPIEAKILNYSIERAQKSIEARNFSARKHVLSYDDVMNRQRVVIYEQRRQILLEDNIRDRIENMITRSVEEKIEEISAAGGSFSEFFQYYRGALDGYMPKNTEQAEILNYKQELCNKAIELYHSKDALAEAISDDYKDAMREIEKSLFLKNLDTHWMEHLESIDDLKSYVGLNSYAQRDPVTMFRIESAEMFEKMLLDIREDTVRQLLAGKPEIKNTQRFEVIKATEFGGPKKASVKSNPSVSLHKNLSRNAKCHCGSGRKYKDCCWSKDQSGK